MSVEQIQHFRSIIDSILTESVLLEAQNYQEMFKEIEDIHDDVRGKKFIQDHVGEAITSARWSLVKKDRVTWFLRLWRIGYLQDAIEMIEENPYGGPDTEVELEFLPKVKQLMNKYVNEYKAKSKSTANIAQMGFYVYRRYTSILRELEHYFSLPIPEIQNFQFGYQPANSVIEYFKSLEKRWQNERTELIPFDPDDGEEILSFGDGFAWYNLNREYCRAEGEAMGHCGNAASYRTGDKVLSLRKKVKVGNKIYVRPSLTFILHADGYLGEMKGRTNEKPNSKYHPYIIALLKSPFIKGITGGGYEPENNFELSDLDNNTIENLLDEKPTLLSFDDFQSMIERNIKLSETVQIAAAMKNGRKTLEALIDAKIRPSDQVQLAAVKFDKSTNALCAIETIVSSGIIPSNAVQLAAVQNNGGRIYFLLMHNIIPKDNVQIAAINNSSEGFRSLIQSGVELSERVQMAAVKKNYFNLDTMIRSGIEPTEKVQVFAVQQNPKAIDYIIRAGIKPSAKVLAAAGK